MSRNGIQRVAVTGGSGHLGRVLITQLLQAGYEVLNIDMRQAEEPLTRFVYADLRHREIVQPLLEQVDAVCHLGEIAHAFAGSPETIFAHNTAAASVVLQSAADLKLKRAIYTSSCQVYGIWGWRVELRRPQYLPMDETHPLNPANSYALSKMANEGFARLMGQTKGLSVAAFRFPEVIIEEHAEHAFHRAMHYTGPAEGCGTYLGVDDAAKAYLLALDDPHPGFEAYHFTAAQTRTPIPVREWLAKWFPQWPTLPPDWPDFKSPVLTDKARRHFGWESTWDFSEHFEQWKLKQPQR